MNHIFERGVVLATYLSILGHVHHLCARLTCFLRPKMREVNAVLSTTQLVTLPPRHLRRAASAPLGRRVLESGKCNEEGHPPPRFSGEALMLAAAEPQVNHNQGDRVTDGGRIPRKTRMLGLIWFPVPRATTSPTTTPTPLGIGKTAKRSATTPATATMA